MAVAWVLALGIAAYLLIVHTRRALVLLGIVGGLAALAVGLLFGQAQFADWRYAQQRENMVATAAYDRSRCPDSGHPVLIAIENRNDRAATYYTFDYSAYREGFSRAVLDSGYGDANSDYIVPAGKKVTSCWSVPHATPGVDQDTIIANAPSTLRWEAAVRSVILEP